MPYLSPAIETLDFLLRKDKEFIEQGDRLTERQREVLQLLAEGKSTKEGAHEVSSHHLGKQSEFAKSMEYDSWRPTSG